MLKNISFHFLKKLTTANIKTISSVSENQLLSLVAVFLIIFVVYA